MVWPCVMRKSSMWRFTSLTKVSCVAQRFQNAGANFRPRVRPVGRSGDFHGRRRGGRHRYERRFNGRLRFGLGPGFGFRRHNQRGDFHRRRFGGRDFRLRRFRRRLGGRRGRGGGVFRRRVDHGHFGQPGPVHLLRQGLSERLAKGLDVEQDEQQRDMQGARPRQTGHPAPDRGVEAGFRRRAKGVWKTLGHDDPEGRGIGRQGLFGCFRDHPYQIKAPEPEFLFNSNEPFFLPLRYHLK